MKLNLFLVLVSTMLIFPVLISGQLASQQSSFEIRSQTGSSLDLRFNLPAWNLEASDAKNPDVKSIKAEDNPKLFIEEVETLPIFTTNIAIPYSGGVTLTVVNRSQATERSLELDCKGILQEEKQKDRLSSDFYPEHYIRISEPKVIRDMRIVSINVYPFQYNPEANLLSISQTIDFRLIYDNLPSQNEIQPPEQYSPNMERIYRAMILNYDSFMGRNATYQAPVMLVIYGNYTDTGYLAKVEEYIAWKKQKGYKVYSASTTTTGTTAVAIKSYIQNAYNNWADRPEYIVLIGDVSGTIAVPTHYSSGTYGEGDYPYTFLAGNDNLGDVVIGRISVSSTSDMQTHMAKVMKMDRDIDLAIAPYLNNMLLVGDPSSSGISTIYSNKYVKELSQQYNPSYNYNEVYSGSFSTQINSSITAGCAFFNYRGYIGMSSWSPPSSPLNGQKLYHAVVITCSTGNFASTGTTESIVRSGSAAGLGGGITAIGMSTSATHTPMNNFLSQGIYHGIYAHGMRNMGEALLYSKLYLNSVYGISNASQALFFAQICNIIGDPTSTVYVGTPESFNVTSLSSIPVGTAHYQLTVHNSANQVVPNAVVTLTNTSSLQVMGMTDEEGSVTLTLPSGITGTMTLTVNKDDYKPAVSTVTLNSAGGVVLESMYVDDGYGGVSSGNGDNIVNSGEVIELWLTVRNTGSTTLNLSGIALGDDPYFTFLERRLMISNLAPGTVQESSIPITFSVDYRCPDNYSFVLNLTEDSGDPTWSMLLPIPVRNAKMDISSYTFVGATGNNIHAGDQFPMSIGVLNTGQGSLRNVYGVLRSYSSFFSVTDTLGYFHHITQGGSANNSGDTFTVSAHGQCINGMVIPLELILYNLDGFQQVISFSVTIGQTTLNDPLGQDAYGYYVFDWGDTSYPQCPAYSWVGIAPAEGGSGTALNLTDPGSSSDEGDQTSASSITTVNLPFSFKFYGVQYNQASISSNGFIAFGASTNSEWRNGRLPGPVGPNPMIAVFWDDLQLNNGSYVYTWYNSSQHYYVVEWYNVINGYDRSTPETFQAILYDPVYYPTATGDGQVKLQYKVFNNIDLGSGDSHPHGNYASIGIKNQDGLIGLEYTFNNTYPTAARALSNEKALFITTSPVPINTPYIMIEQVNVIDLNANNLLEPGEAAQLAIRLGNIGTENASNVSAILSSIDPYITITQSSSGYGTIPAQSNGLPLTNYGVQVSGSAFNGYQAQFSLQISSTEGNWSYDFSLLINTAILSYGEMYVQEVTGNGNNILDPGETVNLIMPLHNTGGAPSPAGTCTLTSSTAGITINSASSDFAAISGGGTANLSFNIQASSGMVIGTLATMGFHTVAGTSTLTGNFSLEVGAPQEIVVGTGTGSQTYPLDRYYNYSTFEAIYTASELNTIGNIKSIAFNKASGSDTNPIEAVSIYLKHTGDSSLSSGAYNLTGYTQVYSGSFPNNAETGWMEVNLSPMFEYDGSSNLQILIVKAYQAWISNYPYWYATTLASNRARQQRSDQAQPTTLDATTARPNLKIKVYAPAQVLYPPRNLTAYASHQSVGLSWNAPVSGTPTGYKIFKNNALLTSVTTLSYTDLQVVNGTSYTYYLKAVYGTEESDPTETVTATPNLVSPSNLIATAGNAFVTLSWNYSQERSSGERNAAETRLASGFKVYRNSVAIATVSQTYYQDLALVNGTTYTYYVTAIYASPDGESDPSNIVTATPTMPSFAILGTENQITANNYISPINLTYKSNHSQFVYTADELNAAGVFGPVYISQIGFNVASSPSLALVNYLVRIKHTTASNAQGWQTADGLVTVYSADTYMPAAGGWDMLVFQTPFLWNGTDNIVFDTSFGMVSEWSRTGTLEYSNYTNGYRYVVSDSAIQASVFTGGSVNSRRPNLKIALQPLYNGPEILASESSLEFGLCQILSAVSLPLTITNNGDQILSGTITSPDGFTIAVSGQRSAQSSASRSAAIIRNTLSFDLEPDASAEYQITFVPTIAGVVSGDLVIASNAINEPELIIGLSGTGFLPTLNIPVVQISLQESGAVLNWQAIEYATEYRIYRAASPAGEYIQIGTTTNLSFTDPNPVEKAFYRVTAVNN